MHFSTLFTASLAVAPFVAAHGGVPGTPKIWGLRSNDAAKLKRRAFAAGHSIHAHAHSHERRDPELNKRQGGLNGMCGPNAGGASCDEGYCCSASGYCGQGEDYCIAPDGLFQYGPANDANVLPAGGSTRSIARPQLGAIPYGGNGVYHCSVPGTVAITYDDGPYLYTQGVLDLFNTYGYRATFFVTGNNNGKQPIDTNSTWSTVIQNMVAGGHQVASHTWSHQDLSSLTQAQRYEQMIKNEMAFANILGKFPTYMRPPYSSCTAASGCAQDMADLGYVVSYFDLDTDDYNNLAPEKIQNAKNNFQGNVSSTPSSTGDWLSVAHDIHQITATNLTQFMLDELKSLGYKGVTMGECLGDSSTNWYRSAPASARTATTSSFSRLVAATATASSATGLSAAASATSVASGASVASSTGTSAATPTALKVSQDGTCGSGYTCIGYDSTVGACCSQYGWCGNDDAHCGTGCQSAFGVCGVSSASSASVAASTAASSTAASASAASVSSAAVASSSSSSSAAASIKLSSVSVQNAAVSTSSSSTRVSSAASSSAASSSTPSAASSSAATSSKASSVASSSVAASSKASSVAASSAAASSSASLSASSSPAVSVAAVSSTTLSTAKSSSSTKVSSSSAAATTKAASSSSSSASSSSVRATSSSSAKTSSSSTKATTASVASIKAVSSSTTASATPAASSLTLSTGGQCGGTTKQTCSTGSGNLLSGMLGASQFGMCCSQFGWCGSTSSYCGTGCQKGYGYCS